MLNKKDLVSGIGLNNMNFMEFGAIMSRDLILQKGKWCRKKEGDFKRGLKGVGEHYELGDDIT